MVALLAVVVCSTVIVPLGDSITQGIAPNHSYRKYLWDLLQRNDKDARFGGSKWGSCTKGKPNEQQTTPEFDQNHEGHCAVDAEGLLQRVKEVPPDDLIKVNSTFVFVAQIIRTTFSSQTAYLNYRIRSCVKETKRVRLVSFPKFSTKTHTFDTTHPNKLGARYIAERWFDAIYPVTPTRKTKPKSSLPNTNAITKPPPNTSTGTKPPALRVSLPDTTTTTKPPLPDTATITKPPADASASTKPPPSETSTDAKPPLPASLPAASTITKPPLPDVGTATKPSISDATKPPLPASQPDASVITHHPPIDTSTD
eukprot:TRINITY_DN28435_c0_g1_i1.p1 TRINITY_DN28435_c0_g1~~TRINITY_DN28435_c0_g1_i1.p1  ORF type:complete len:328 (+),score=60.59 TRINITY_DN28435_c0_g1_i1:49-984(+)